MFSKFRLPVITSCRQANKFQRYRGRRSSTTVVMPQNAGYFHHTTSKTFTRQMLMRFGNTSVDDAILILNPGGKNKLRKLDEKKRKQLSLLYFENVVSVICGVPEAAEAGVVVTKVDAPNRLNELKIFWQAFGDERDIKVKQVLNDNAEIIRRQLSETLYHSNVPPLTFIPDRSELILEEMNRIFEAADYGMQYRALSHTGAVLGSQKDDGASTVTKEEKVPRFILAKRKKIEEKKMQMDEKEDC